MAINWFIKWLWKRDSESAACVCIYLSESMTIKDLADLESYLREVRKFKTAIAEADAREVQHGKS